MKITKPPAARDLPDCSESALNLPETDTCEFLSRGVAAGAEARQTGVTICVEGSIARLKALAAEHAASASVGGRR